jgi:hypothetical protein
MPVGLPVDKFQLDQQAGNLARTLEQFANQAEQLKTYLDATPDTDLEEPPFNYSPEDVALLKSAVTDMAKVAGLYQGTDSLAAPQDLGVFSRRLMGLYLGG